MVNEEQIAKFLEGRNPQKYIVGVEIPYGATKVSLIINDPIKGKYIKHDEITSLLWFKEDITKMMYGGNRSKISQACTKFGVSLSRLKTNINGEAAPERMLEGFKFMAKCKGAYSKLLNFFKQGGIDVYGDTHKSYFVAINPVEQYLIATGKRLFKGMDDYDDLHRLQFDLETTGLKPKGDSLSNSEIRDVKNRMNGTEDLTQLYEFDDKNEPIRNKDCTIFQIGVKDNRGFEDIIEIDSEKGLDKREQEIYLILKFFDYIKKMEPDAIIGYNSENFDWYFIFTRCEILGVDIEMIAKTLDKSGNYKIKRIDKSIKLGGEREYYKQTTMYGYNIVDAYHAVRRAKAINSDIKSAGLKYITKFAELNKSNRVYVEGDKIYKIWADNDTKYAFNDVDGTYYPITIKSPLKEGYEVVMGKTIVRRYLLDDLWETEQVDKEFNQASFLLSKIIPTSYMRSITMGTAGIWKLIMLGWSYENRLAVPNVKSKQTFTGGLSRLLEVGFAKNVAKLDFAALYPNIEITWDIFPNTDITGVMRGMLIYIASTRDKFKNLMNMHKDKVKELTAFVEENDLNEEQLTTFNAEIKKNGELASTYDKEQLPIKILGNSFFGSLGAPNIFNWGDVDCAEETTCRGRQYLRLMVRFFVDRDFRPLVGDTDGFNFATPKNINENIYTPKGTHRFTEKNKDKELIGLNAIVAEFNELFMIGRMGLDIDDICETTINFSRKNYANLIDGKIKLVGNTIKSSKMPIYIEEFLEVGSKYLLNGQGFEFIQLYNKTVDDIYNYRVPLVKIASKANVKQTVSAYKKDCKTFTKSGSFKARKAYMELILKENLKVSLGDTIYYVNTGTVKSHGDCKVTTDKETKERTVALNCMLIPTDQIQNNPELTTTEYNVAKYLANFNKRIKPLLVCFKPEIRKKILIDMVKNSKTKEMELGNISVFTKSQCKLDSGNAHKDGDQDTMEELMTMEDKEIEFWIRTDKSPNNLIELNMDWDWIQKDFHERKRVERIEGIENEKKEILYLIKKMELREYNTLEEDFLIPKAMANIAHFDVHNNKNGEKDIFIISNKWDVDLGTATQIFKYKPWAIKRATWYETLKINKKKTFEFWLEHEWVEAKRVENEARAESIKNELELVGIKLDIENYKEIKSGV